MERDAGAVQRIVRRCVPRRTIARDGVERLHGVVWVEPRVVFEVSHAKLRLGGVPSAREHEPADRNLDIEFPMVSL